MNINRARNSCSMASLIRGLLQTAAQDRIYSRAGQYRDMNPTLHMLADTSSLLRRACRLGYHGAAKRLANRVDRLAANLRHELNNLPSQLGHTFQVPTVAEIAGELQQIDDEFGEWHYSWQFKHLSVRTGPIELEDVYLGPFAIWLELDGLARFVSTPGGTGQHPFTVVAIDPHPASGNKHITHPHVSDDRLCTGESTLLITAALMEGRLADFFLIVRGLLQTYNPDSPYVPLDSWSGTTCNECGQRVHEDDRYFCEICNCDVCDGCSGRCNSCDESACLGCLTNCKHCEEYHCQNCTKRCAECNEPCCVGCLDEELCPACVEDKENQDNDEEQEQAETTHQEDISEVATTATPAP